MFSGLFLLVRGFDLIGLFVEFIQKFYVNRGMFIEGFYRFMVLILDKIEVFKIVSWCNIKFIIKV